MRLWLYFWLVTIHKIYLAVHKGTQWQYKNLSVNSVLNRKMTQASETHFCVWLVIYTQLGHWPKFCNSYLKETVLVCFAFQWRNTWDWLPYKEKVYLTCSSAGYKNMAPASAQLLVRSQGAFTHGRRHRGSKHVTQRGSEKERRWWCQVPFITSSCRNKYSRNSLITTGEGTKPFMRD